MHSPSQAWRINSPSGRRTAEFLHPMGELPYCIVRLRFRSAPYMVPLSDVNFRPASDMVPADSAAALQVVRYGACFFICGGIFAPPRTWCPLTARQLCDPFGHGVRFLFVGGLQARTLFPHVIPNHEHTRRLARVLMREGAPRQGTGRGGMKAFPLGGEPRVYSCSPCVKGGLSKSREESLSYFATSPLAGNGERQRR